MNGLKRPAPDLDDFDECFRGSSQKLLTNLPALGYDNDEDEHMINSLECTLLHIGTLSSPQCTNQKRSKVRG